MTTESGQFAVGDAELYYEKRGSGPSVLLISGAGGDGGQWDAFADLLSDAFTVISYDRRGNSRSTGRTESAMSVSQQADDAAALIRGLAGGTALVLGNSGGAIVALELAVRHPEVVRAIVAHEPPAVKVLPADDEWFGFFERLSAVYQEAGPQAAGGTFVQTVRGEGTYPWPDEFAARFFGNADFLFKWEWDAWGAWTPDEAALKKATFPIVLGAGADDRGSYYARPSVEIAARIGAPWVEFPGIHLELMRNPERFEAAARAVLTHLHTMSESVPHAWNSESA